MPDPPRVGILISGRGSNMVALVEAMQARRVAAEPAVVISNVAEAAGLAAARERGVPVEVVSHRKLSRSEHERSVVERLRQHRVDLVCLAGYMRLLSPAIIAEFPRSILNVHPSLLPAFPGLDAQRQALEHGVRFAGCTVHLVDETCDHGPIVLQAVVPVLDDDTEEALAARILVEEHRIYAEALDLVARDRFSLDGRRVRLKR